MQHSIPTYSLAERDRRWALARRLMEEQSVDVLLVFGEREGALPAPFAFDTYFTNDRPGSLVLFPRDGEPVAFIPLPMYAADNFEARQRGDDVWMGPSNLRFPRSPGAIAEAVRQFGGDTCTVGVVGAEPMPPYYFVPPIPAALQMGLAQALPSATFKPVGHRMLQMMMSLSIEELAVVRRAAAIGDDMVRAMIDATRPGVSEAEIYGAATSAAIENGMVPPMILLQSGPETIGWGPVPWAYRPQAPRTIAPGDVVLAEVFTSLGMKETQHQVTIAVGGVHDDFHRAHEAAQRSYRIGLETLEIGRTFGEVTTAMREEVRSAGGNFVHPVVHGMNPFGTVSGVPMAFCSLAATADYGIEGEIPMIGAELPIREAMTFAFEPNCAIGRRVVNIGGTVLTSAEGAIELNPLTSRMHQVDG